MTEKIEITPEDKLLRRVVYPYPHLIKPDGKLSSLAFKPRSGVDKDGLSVDLERLTTFDTAIVDRSKYRLYSLSAKVPFGLGLECVHDPIPENYAHALIKGISKSIARKLSRAAQRVA